MAFYKTCPFCQSNNDPGEICSCLKERDDLDKGIVLSNGNDETVYIYDPLARNRYEKSVSELQNIKRRLS